MANGVKTYQIQINGITESVKAVDALNKELSTLESRIKALEGKSVGVKSSGGGSTSSKSSLSEEEKIAKQIEQIDAKREAYSKEIYQNYLAAKDVLKETVKDQNAIAASERLQAKTYSNTIMGMKQELADIKSAMQTVDLGDTGQLDKMVKRANELNDALKKIEESYGQFGRNVGNYASAFEGMQKLSINIGGVVREFNSAREASKTLKNELIGLESAGSGNTEVAKQLRTEYYKLQSAMDDATKSSKAMDAAMDTMQSFTALASVGNGFKAFFGFDDNEVQKSIQRLVALQGVLTGLETLRKQMETGEGIGAVFSKSFKSIDTATHKLLVYNRALLGTGTAAKAAEIGIKGLTIASKALASIGIVAIISGIVWAMQKAFDAVSNWVKGNADLVTSEQRLKAALDATNDSLERNLKLNQAKYDAGKINVAEKQVEDEKAYADAIRQTNDELERRAKLNPNNSTFANAMNNAGANSWSEFLKNDKGVTTLGGFTEASGTIEELTKRYKALSDAVEKDTGLVYKNAKGFEICHLTASDVKDELNHLEQFMAGQLVGTMKQFDTTTEQGRESLQNFVNGIMQNGNDLRKSILLRLPEIVDNEKGNLGTALNGWLSLIKQFVANADAAMKALDFEKYANSILDAADETGKRMAQRQRDELTARYNALSDEEKKAQKSNYDKALKAIDQLEKKKRQKVSNNYKKLEKETREAENDLANLKIANMKEGLNKVLRQLEEERKQRLAKVEADGKLVAERQAEINTLYEKKILDATKEWAENVEKTYRNMWNNIYSYSLETQNKIVEASRQKYETSSQNIEFGRSTLFPSNVSSYGVQGKNQLSTGTQIELQLEEQNNKKLAETYKDRIKFIEDYWKERLDLTLKSENDIRNKEIELENQSFKREFSEMNDHYRDLNKEIENGLSAGTIIEEDAEILREKNLKEFQNRQEILVKKHEDNILKILQDSVKRFQNENAEYYRSRLQELRDFQTAISNLEAKQPVYNSWGIINLKKTNENNEILLESYRKLADEIVNIRRKLQNQLDENEISFDDFQNANRELDSFADNVGQKMDEIKRKLTIADQVGLVVQSINQYVQTCLQSIQTVANAISDFNMYILEKEQDELDKWNDKLEDALDKQQDIVQKHKDAIDDIESELAEARGDRREHLISQLNEEMAAQRAAQKEEQRIQRQKEVAERKQQELDKKRRKEEYERNVIQAFISWHMAIANGLATQPFMPLGIAMGALATVLGGIQYALVKSQKPYAKGGVLEGPSHKQGGIPVGNTGIEVEGKEYVVRKKSTTPNVELLDYINRSERKLSLDDFIDFYSSGKLKKNISSISPKRTFADGGTIPTITNDYAFDDRLLSAFEDYSNRPVYVSVVDINNRQDAVKNVQVLAGLSD